MFPSLKSTVLCSVTRCRMVHTYISEEPAASIFRVKDNSGLCSSVRRTRSKLSWLSSFEMLGINRYFCRMASS